MRRLPSSFYTQKVRLPANEYTRLRLAGLLR